VAGAREAVTRAELEACEDGEGVQLAEGDILLLRMGHHRLRQELGPWDNGLLYAGTFGNVVGPDLMPHGW
jgi:hypothetical protein